MTNLIEETYKSAIKFLAPLTLEEAYALSVDEAVRLVKADYGTVYLYNDNKFQSVYTNVPPEFQSDPRPKGNTFESFKTGIPRLLNRQQLISAHPELTSTPVQSLVIIPLAYKKVSLGAITLQSRKVKYFTAQKLKVLKLIGSIATLGIRNIQLYSETKRAVQLQDLYISMASHELKTPLTTISAYVELLGKEKANVKHPQWIDTLSSEVVRLKRLIAELLEAEQIKSGKLTYEWNTVNLREVIATSMIDFSSNNPECRVVFHDKSNNSDDIIWADHDKLVQVFDNILNNAAKFSPPNSEVSITLVSAAPYLLVSIADKGKGIRKSDLKRVFEKFYRGKESKGGLGLGLYLTSNIVRHHKGLIQIKSKLHKGTQVDVYLPKLHHARKKMRVSSGA